MAHIVKTSRGYKIVTPKGKSLTKSNLTKEQAEKRLNQIEWFKKRKPEESATEEE